MTATDTTGIDPADSVDTTDVAVLDAVDGVTCSREEAEQLVTDAVKHANGLLENIHEIYQRRAWIPLGYRTVGDLLKSPMIATKVLNPVTGSPYTRQHLHRIATAVNLQAAIAEAAHIDIADIAVDEKRLRELRASGVADAQHDITEEIADRVANSADPDAGLSAEEAQGIADRRLAGEDAAGAPRSGEAAFVAPDGVSAAVGAPTDDDRADGLDDADEAAVDDAARARSAAQAPESAGYPPQNPAAAAENWPEQDTRDASDGEDRSSLAVNAFDEAMAGGRPEAPGSRAPEPSTSMQEALAAAQAHTHVTNAATTLENFADDMRRAVSAIEPAVTTAREVLTEMFTIGDAGQAIVHAEDKGDALYSSLTPADREDLARRLDRASAVAPAVHAVGDMCSALVEREDFTALAGQLNLLRVAVGRADDIQNACTVLAAALRGEGSEGDLDDLLASLGV